MRLPLLVPFAALALTLPLAPAIATTYTFTTLNVPGTAATDLTAAYGINNAGQVVGTIYSPTASNAQGFVLDQASGTYTVFSDPGAIFGQGFGTYAVAINNVGQIVGFSAPLNSSGFFTGFLRDPATGAITDLAPADGGASTTPRGINDSGQIVGTYSVSRYSLGFLLDGTTGNYTYPPAFGFQIDSNFRLSSPRLQPTGINNGGQVVGGNVLFDLATSSSTPIAYPGGLSTYANSINNSGQIAGVYFMNDQAAVGFVLDEATGLFSSLSDPDGTNTFAQGINDRGQVVGTYLDRNGISQGFIATPQASTPITEPASIALVGTTVLGLGWFRRRRFAE